MTSLLQKRINRVSLSLIFYYCVMLSVMMIFISDAISKYTRVTYGFMISTPVRMMVLIILLLIALSSKRIIPKIYKNIFLLLVLMSSLISGMLLSGMWINDSFSDVVYMSSRYISGLVFLIIITSIDFRFLSFSKILHFVFFINIASSLVGYFTDARFLRTYGHIESISAGWIDERFGFNGLILEQNISSYFYFLCIINAIFLFKNKHIGLISLIISCVSTVLVGTKTLIALEFLAILAIIVNGYTTRIILSVISIFSFVGCFFYFNVDVGNLFTYDILNVATSFRLQHFFEKLYPKIVNLEPYEYIFGIQGSNFSEFLTEFEFVDLLSYFGVFGSIVYISIYLLCSKWVFKIKNGISIFIVLILGAFFSGHLFYDPTTMFYYSIFCVAMKEYYVKQIQKQNMGLIEYKSEFGKVLSDVG